MKDDLPYFSHDNDAHLHPKMKALRARFGWAGYGQFWALNEMIAGAPRARLDLSRKVVRAATACELGMTPDGLDDFLGFLSDPDECGLVDYSDGIVTTERTQDDYEKMDAGRRSAQERYTRKKTSPENRETSPEKDETSANFARETIENRIELEQNRIKQQPRARATLVDNFPEPGPEAELAAFEAWALGKAKEAKARNPKAYAKTLMADPSRLEEFRASLAPEPERTSAFVPAPGPCDCGGTIRANTFDGIGECTSCHLWYHYDRTFEAWVPDDVPAKAGTG